MSVNLTDSVEVLGLSVRSRNGCINGGIATVGDLVQRTAADLLHVRQFGRKSLREVREALAEHGLVLKEKHTGYHKRLIVTRGVLGEPSKIREELEELEEAVEQGNHILVLCELADLYGALEAVVERRGVSMDDVRTMAAATKSAFLDGSRSPK